MKKNIAIIGAGISGLETAKNLIASNKFNVKIYEASNNFGGRIRKNETFCDYGLELGAEEVHGVNSEYYKCVLKAGGQLLEYWDLENMYCYYNPNRDFDVKKKLKILSNNSETSYKDGPKTPDEDLPEVHQLEKQYALTERYPELKFLNDLFENLTYKKSEQDIPNLPLNEYLRMNNIPETAFFYGEAFIGTESGSDSNHVSIQGFAKMLDQWKSGVENLILTNMTHYDVLAKTYSHIVDKNSNNPSYNNDKARKSEILLNFNTQISEINYIDKNIIKLYDQNNNCYEYDYVVICVPLKQYSNIKFLPELSPEKKDALNRIGLDNTGKLFLKFSKPLWPNQAVVMITPGLGNIYWPSNNGKNSKDFVLNALIGGDNCRTLTYLYKKDRKEFLDYLFDSLKYVFGRNARDYLIDYIWYDWSEVPFVGCGYTFMSVEEKEDDRDTLGYPIENRLFFAGEAFAKNGHIATIHGAQETGYNISDYIINNIV